MFAEDTSLMGVWVSLVWLVFIILIAFWPTRVASRKGHSFILYFILSLIFFPLAIILAYVVSDRRAAYH